MKSEGLAWISKSGKVLFIGYFKADGSGIDDDLRFMLFMEDLDKLRDGEWSRPSVNVYKADSSFFDSSSKKTG